MLLRDYSQYGPHQGIGGSVPWERFRLPRPTDDPWQIVQAAERSEVVDLEPVSVDRWCAALPFCPGTSSPHKYHK